MDEALQKLALQDPQAAELVKLRFFVGMDYAEAAEGMGISTRTAKRCWSFARAWLYRELSGRKGNSIMEREFSEQKVRASKPLNLVGTRSTASPYFQNELGTRWNASLPDQLGSWGESQIKFGTFFGPNTH